MVLQAIRRDLSLIIASICLVILMNFTFGRYILYPFSIFSTWVHEMCHGMAALMMGETIIKLEIFKDGSGLATLTGSSDRGNGFIASAGYPGTAVAGCFFLLIRKTTYGPKIGLVALGLALILSCILYVRNTFGLVVFTLEGLLLLLSAFLLKSPWKNHLFNFLAMTICLNAFMSIHQLFGTNQAEINGQVYSTDAHAVALLWGGGYRLWALLWLLGSLVATIVGIVCAPDTRPRDSSTEPTSSDTGAAETPTNGTYVPNNDEVNMSSTTPADDTTATTTKPGNPGSFGSAPFLTDTV